MNNLRRKIILSAPLFSTGGALVGCGEDSTAPERLTGGGARASAQSATGLTGQSLKLSAVSVLAKLDPIWDKSTYLVPAGSPTLTGCLNGTGLYLSMSETVSAAATATTPKTTIIRSLMLSLSNGAKIVQGSRFLFDGNKRCSGVLTVLKRTATGTDSWAETLYAYGVTESAISPGVVQLTSYLAGQDQFALQLSNLRLAPKGTSAAVNSMKLAGNTSFQGRRANANWM
jgi:hypothetical protein